MDIWSLGSQTQPGTNWETEKEKSRQIGRQEKKYEKIKSLNTHFYTYVDQDFSREKDTTKGSGWRKVNINKRKREKITINNTILKREEKNWREV
jgi:hypothetical protein